MILLQFTNYEDCTTQFLTSFFPSNRSSIQPSHYDSHERHETSHAFFAHSIVKEVYDVTVLYMIFYLPSTYHDITY